MMLDDMLARNLYVPIDEYPHVKDSASVEEAIILMQQSLDATNQYRSILVMDQEEHLVGYLSLRDLIRAVGPEYMHKKSPQIKGHQPFHGVPDDVTALSLIWQEGFTRKIKTEMKKPVGEAMTLFQDQIKPDDHFAKCLHLMLMHDELILPVVEGDKVLGVVRMVDLFDRIAECLQKKSDNPAD